MGDWSLAAIETESAVWDMNVPTIFVVSSRVSTRTRVPGTNTVD